MKALLTAIAFIIMSAPAFAADKTDKTSANAATGGKSTNVSFDELLIQGKYHFSDEAVITVEQDKILDALLGVRKDFKDRLEQSASRQ
jgi:hypothetical protein